MPPTLTTAFIPPPPPTSNSKSEFDSQSTDNALIY